MGLAEVVPVRRDEGLATPLASKYLPLSSLARSDGWILVPAESEGYSAGSLVQVRPWPLAKRHIGGRIDEAEGVLSSIPVGGGCSGGANVELADFWLRHKKNLQKSLEMFKKAAKGDPTNPLWGYHIARVYLALGWSKEARQILKTIVDADSIDGSLRENAIQLLKGSA